MAIIAVCPYCQQGKVRAPDHAEGLSATCPRCASSFTIVDSAELARPQRPFRREASAAAPPAPPTAPPELAPTPPADEPAPMTELPALRLPASPIEGMGSGPALPLALVALTLGGLGLLASQFPYGRFITVALAALGLLLGLGALLLAERRRRVPLFATLLNAIALVLALALPSWLGMSGWRPPQVEDDRRTVQAVGNDGAAPVPADWVDAATASWQLDDVRIAIVGVAVGPVELIGPKKHKRRAKKPALMVRVRITNVGVARQFEFHGWSAPTAAPRLADAAGKELKAAQFEPGWVPVEQPRIESLLPGRSAEQVLYFTPSTATNGPLRLELPGAAFGAAEPARLLISPTTIYHP